MKRKNRKLKRGEKVRDRYGVTHTAALQIGNTVYLDNGEWIHRSNCVRLDKWGEVAE